MQKKSSLKSREKIKSLLFVSLQKKINFCHLNSNILIPTSLQPAIVKIDI